MSFPHTGALQCISRKRSRDETERGAGVDTRPFTIQHASSLGLSSNSLEQPKTLQPICLLTRSQLPLSFLDPTPRGSRLFTGPIQLLDATVEVEDEHAVLIARDAHERRLYAIERAGRSARYSLCRIGDWVTETMLQQQSQSALHPPLNPPPKRRGSVFTAAKDSRKWWECAVACDPPAIEACSATTSSPSPALWMKSNLALKSDEPKHLHGQTSTAITAASSPCNDLLGPSNDSAQLPDALEELAKHYLDALYLSRISLAYFTKGPLPRAKVALSSATTNVDRADLATFLRDSILSSSVMDTKYRESIPSMINDLPVATSGDPSDKTATKKKPKRPKWKPKRTKAGFFIFEQDFIESWWRRADVMEDAPPSAQKMDSTLRSRLAKLRNRETFLQIILILEVLALDAAVPTVLHQATDAASSTSTSHPKKAESQQNHTPTTKVKKQQHLPTHLEAMLDKLCIWHSLESHSPVKKSEIEPQPDEGEPSDELKSFCVEVVIPFFASRIPEYAALVNKKFGGPTAPSPEKRRSINSGKHGDAINRKARAKAVRKPLSRVSTENRNEATSFQPNRPPALHRAATDSMIDPFIKREGIEPPMDSIPALKAAASHSRSSSTVPQLQHFSKREVDLTAVAATNEAKIRKKKDVESKLKEAVEMLKKPNRALASKEDETRIDERFATATAKTRQKANPPPMSRNHATEPKPSIHVSSTPTHARMIKATPLKPSHSVHTDDARSSGSRGGTGTTHIPSSTLRVPAPRAPPSSGNTPSISQSSHPNFTLSGIQETPSRGFAKFMPAGLAHLPGTLEYPSVSGRSGTVQQTPCKGIARVPIQPLRETSPNTTRPRPRNLDPNHEAAVTIYDTLGWESEGYEELK